MLVKSDREKGEIAASVPPCPYLELHPERGRVRSAAAAKSLQSCPTLCDPIDGSPHQAPSSLGFSRQGHWSGLPFPFPMHESER